MAERILINPVTRIEGHAKISIYLNDFNEVESAQFHVVEFRGFEKICEGRPFHEMPGLMARTCGICPVSHVLASSKAGDALLGVEIPTAAVKQRRLINYGQILQSHALSFFYLSAPDFLLGFDSDPAQRHVLGLAERDPDLARATLAASNDDANAVLGGVVSRVTSRSTSPPRAESSSRDPNRKTSAPRPNMAATTFLMAWMLAGERRTIRMVLSYEF